MVGVENGRLKDLVVLFIHVYRNATENASTAFCFSECYLQYLCPTFVSYFVHILFLASPSSILYKTTFRIYSSTSTHASSSHFPSCISFHRYGHSAPPSPSRFDSTNSPDTVSLPLYLHRNHGDTCAATHSHIRSDLPSSPHRGQRAARAVANDCRTSQQDSAPYRAAVVPPHC